MTATLEGATDVAANGVSLGPGRAAEPVLSGTVDRGNSGSPILDDFGPLLPAEQQLLDACRAGRNCVLEGIKARRLRHYRAWLQSPEVVGLNEQLAKATLSIERQRLIDALNNSPRSDEVRAFLDEFAAFVDRSTKDEPPVEGADDGPPDLDEILALSRDAILAYIASIEPSFALAKFRQDPDHRRLIRDVVRAGEAPPEALAEVLDDLPIHLQEIIADVRRLVAGHPRLPDNVLDRLDAEPGLIDRFVDEALDRAGVEATGWRAVDRDDETLHVRAAFIGVLCSSGDALGLGPRIQLQGARVVGELDFDGVEISRKLQFFGCWIDERLQFHDTKASLVSLSGCHIVGLLADRSTFDGGLYLRRGLRSTGPIELLGCEIAGHVDCHEATLHVPSGRTLAVQYCRIEGSLFLDRLWSVGTIEGYTSQIAMNVQATGATLRGDSGVACGLGSFEIGGNVSLGADFTCAGALSILRCRIGRSIDASGAVFRRSMNSDTAFNARDAIIEGSVDFGAELTLVDGVGPKVSVTRVQGVLQFTNAKIAGGVDALGAVIRDDEYGACLRFGGASVGGDVHLGAYYLTTTDISTKESSVEAFHSTYLGVLDFSGARIGGAFTLRGARATAGHATCLDLTSARVGTDIDFGNEAEFKGCVQLYDAEIGGNLMAQGSSFKNPDGYAIAGDRITVKGNVFLSDGFNAEGDVRLPHAKFANQLTCVGGKFVCPSRFALLTDHAEIAGNVSLGHGFESIGLVSCEGIRTRGSVLTAGGTFSNMSTGEPATALSVKAAQIEGTLILGPDAVFDGRVDLSRAHARGLTLHQGALPPARGPAKAGASRDEAFGLETDGLTYDHLEFGDQGRPIDILTAFLGRERSVIDGTEVRTQPFEQAATVLQRMGREEDAKTIARMKTRIRRKQDAYKVARLARDGYASRRGAFWVGLFLLCAAGWWLQWSGLIERNLAALSPDVRAGLSAVLLLGVLVSLLPAGRALTQLAKVGVTWIGYDLLLGSGYAKSRPVVLYLVLLILGGWVYEQAAQQKAIVPVSQLYLINPEVRRACAGRPVGLDVQLDWARCEVAPYGLNAFRPYWYSLDLMLQFGPLGQRRDWEPDATPIALQVPFYGAVAIGTGMLKTFSWLQSIVALGLYALMLGAVTGLIKK